MPFHLCASPKLKHPTSIRCEGSDERTFDRTLRKISGPPQTLRIPQVNVFPKALPHFYSSGRLMSRRFFEQTKNLFECSDETHIGRLQTRAESRLHPAGRCVASGTASSVLSKGTSCRGGCAPEGEYAFTGEAAHPLPDRIWLGVRGTCLISNEAIRTWED